MSPDLSYPLCHSAFSTKEYGLGLTLLLGGLVGSVTHCAGMCGPFVLAQASGFSTPPGKDPAAWYRGLLLPYHLGRLTTYTLLGVAASLLTAQLFQFPALHIISHLLLALAGVLFLAAALSRLAPAFSFGACKTPAWLMQRISLLLPSPTRFNGYMLGLLLGFLPCGLVYAALLAAAATGNPFQAALGMALFALGTMPALMMIGLGGKTAWLNRHAWVRPAMTALMIFNSALLFVIAGKGLV